MQTVQLSEYPYTSLSVIRARRMAIRNAAHRITSRAILEGRLHDPRTLKCADCGTQAYAYDHRDYRQPLMVDPICRRCNSRRGRGLPWCPIVNDTTRVSQREIVVAALYSKADADQIQARALREGVSLEEFVWRAAIIVARRGEPGEHEATLRMQRREIEQLRQRIQQLESRRQLPKSDAVTNGGKSPTPPDIEKRREEKRK